MNTMVSARGCVEGATASQLRIRSGNPVPQRALAVRPGSHSRLRVSAGPPSATAQTTSSRTGNTLKVETYTRQVPKGGLAENTYHADRVKEVAKHFPTALHVDDFIARVEVALFKHNFTDQNSISVCNVCRDEVTGTFKTKLDQVFGLSFNSNGLGGVLTCGVTGMKAGLSHSPIEGERERYIFFSFPHIAIDASGKVGAISRPGRPGESCACGAMAGALGTFKAQGLSDGLKAQDVHDTLDPEFSILKQRLARRAQAEGITEADVQNMSLVDITQLAERTITDDLEQLIQHAVDPSKADYAVVTGVQIHNWGVDFDDEDPNLEVIAPSSVYVVVNGECTYIDLSTIPVLTPRQIKLLGSDSTAGIPGPDPTVDLTKALKSYAQAITKNAGRLRSHL